ncbi:unnamed protein product [Paramecium pentaurelia]|uniref:Cyclic nucleotide-binding domain-containing protein n=1 Tax=Paramecium pentaurelia TaxID=43138 RepID=A0A8S1V621_9CILI|nr:unnamed protein product [Paramecium pentaurelia]
MIMPSQFAVSDRQLFDFKKPQNNSDSEEEQQQQLLLLQNCNKETKRQKKLLDIEAIKQELNNRPQIDYEVTPKIGIKASRLMAKSLSNFILPTSPVLIEQLLLVRSIRLMKEQLPIEIMNKVYSELRYLYVPANTAVYRQGDQHKKYYIILDGKCVVMKPKEKMLGLQKLEQELECKTKIQFIRKNDPDPYGLKSAFPDYLILKVLINGDSFGEAAIKLNITRSSTVFAIENSHLLFLSEQAYLQLLDPFLSKSLDDKIIYFTQTPIFKEIDFELNEIIGILLECHQITYKSSEILYEEDESSNHIYFIINGQVELSKQLNSKHLVLSSYGENQHFGEVEVFHKIPRYTKARVISPRLTVYKIRQSKFFDNLGNIQIYQNFKNNSKIILKHWTIIYQTAKSQDFQKDEIFQAAQDQLTNRRNEVSKKIVNKKIIEVQGVKLSQVKVFQNLADSNIQDIKSIGNSPNKTILQRVYSNALQQYQARLLKKPSQTQCSDDHCIRSQKYPLNNERTFNTERSSPDRRNSMLNPKLPTMTSNSSSNSKVDLNQVFESISKLPRIPRDNLVLSLMYQQAYKSENPHKKAKQIQQVIQASFRNVRRDFESKEKVVSNFKYKSADSIIKNLKQYDPSEERRFKEEYMVFVQSKRLS